MSTKKEIHYSGLLTDGKLHDQKIQDCQIVGIQCEAIEAVHCVFQNVIFKSSFMRTMVFVENCEFIDCVFQDIFENVTLEWSKSLEGFYIENCDATGFTLILERYSHYVKNLVL